MNYYKLLAFIGVETGSNNGIYSLDYEGLSAFVVEGETAEEAKNDFLEESYEWGCLGAYIASELLPSSEEEFNWYDSANDEEQKEFAIKTEKEAKEKGVFYDLDVCFPKNKWKVENYSEKNRYNTPF